MTAIRSKDTELIVIAQFSKAKALIFALLLFLLIGFGWLAPFYHPSDMSLDAWHASKNEDLYGGLFVMAMCTLAAVVNQIDVLKRFLFHNAIAIWQDGGKIIFLNENFVSVWKEIRVADIASISQGTWYLFPAIVLMLKDGSKLTLANRTYCESTDKIVSRFQRVLELPLSR